MVGNSSFCGPHMAKVTPKCQLEAKKLPGGFLCFRGLPELWQGKVSTFFDPSLPDFRALALTYQTNIVLSPLCIACLKLDLNIPLWTKTRATNVLNSLKAPPRIPPPPNPIYLLQYGPYGLSFPSIIIQRSSGSETAWSTVQHMSWINCLTPLRITIDRLYILLIRSLYIKRF